MIHSLIVSIVLSSLGCKLYKNWPDGLQTLAYDGFIP